MADDTRTFTWTLELADKFTKPMKAVQTQWDKTAQAGVRKSKQMKTGISSLSKSFKDFTKNLKENVTQIKSFTKAIVAGLAVIGVGALAVGLLGAFKKLLYYSMQLDEQILSLASVTDVTSGSLDILTSEAWALAEALGQDFEKSIEMMKAIQDVRPLTRGTADDFRAMTSVIVDYATATDSSVESTAELFSNLELMGGTPHDIRRLGDSMKYWADQTKLTNAEVQSIVQSTKSLVGFLPKGKRIAAMGEFAGISGVLAETFLGDPQQLMQAYDTLANAVATHPLHGFVSQMLPGGRAALQEAMATGDYISVFEALIKASKKARVQYGGLSGLRGLGEHVEAYTGLSSELVAALSELEIGAGPKGVRTLVQQAQASDALAKANAAKRTSMLRDWERVKQKFLQLVSKISGPLTRFIDKILDPLYNWLDKLTTAGEGFLDFMMADANKDIPFFKRLKAGLKGIWTDMGGPELMDELWEGIKSWIVGHDVGKWIGENVLYPAFSSVLSPFWAKKILKMPTIPVEKPEPKKVPIDDLLQAYVKHVPSKQTPTERSEYEGLLDQMIANTDVITEKLKTLFRPGSPFSRMTEEQFKSWVESGGRIAGLEAMDKAYEASLIYSIVQDMFPPGNQTAEGS